MRIKRIEIFKLNVPLNEPFVISLEAITDANNLLVRIHTDETMESGAGLFGIGEASPLPTIAGETQETQFALAPNLAQILCGKDPLEIENRLAELDRVVAGNTTLKSAFDMALFDIAAKKANMPLYQFLGGANDRAIRTDMTVGIDTPENMAEKALRYKNKGFAALKIKLGTTCLQDVARIKAIREAVGYEIPIRIDANQGWDVVTAIRTLKALEPFDIEHCEEPVSRWNNAALVRVRENSPISIMADESGCDHHDAFRLAASGACDYFNIKLAKSGGIFNALKILAVAEAAGIKSQVGCMQETRFALTALAHLVAARKNIVHFDIDSCLMLSHDPVTGGIEYRDGGSWILPEAPGIGAGFDDKYLDTMPKTVVQI